MPRSPSEISSVIVLPTSVAPASSRALDGGGQAFGEPAMGRRPIRIAAARDEARDVEQVLGREGQAGQRARPRGRRR